MEEKRVRELEQMALRVREHIIRMAGRGGCFIGSALSCCDIIVYLYNCFLNISKEALTDVDRDYLFLSKGHAVPALYGVFAELGWLEKERLSRHLDVRDQIYWHPNTAVPGVEFHSGSLGHLLGIALGAALDCKLKNRTNRVVVITGDGELNEGSIWETLLNASALRLDNLTVVVDRNKFQANKQTEELIPLEPLNEKFEAFGCPVRRGDGHSFPWMNQVFRELPFAPGKPAVIIAETIRGKGLPGLEQRVDRWFAAYSETEARRLIEELHSREKKTAGKE